MRPSPMVVVTLPARTLKEASALALQARGAGADVAELRLDLLDPGELHRLSELFPAPLPLMATLRSLAEGGRGPNESSSREETLRAVESLPFAWVDRESRRDFSTPGDPAQSERPRARTVASTHLAPGWTAEQLAAALGGFPKGAEMRKLVLPATLADLWNSRLLDLPDAMGPDFVLHTTDASGPLLRAWSRRLGMPAVYAAPPETKGGPAAVEPAQIPVDRLSGYLASGGRGPLFGVLGNPIDHSLSPRLHSDWMRQEGRDGLYVALRVDTEEELAQCLPELAERGFHGFNVTHPWKQAAFRLADTRSPAAESVECANTLSRERDGWHAENTDLGAILRRLTELKASGRWKGRRLTVVGAGGSARATLAAARLLRADAVVVARRADAAANLAKQFGATAAEPGGPEPSGGLVIHASPVGAVPGPLEVPLAPLLHTGDLLLDFVYSPRYGEIAGLAQAAGAEYEDGWRLLVYQASESYGVWWGTRPSPEAMERSIREGP